MRAAVREHQQRVLTGSVERRRQHEQALDVPAGFRSEPELAGRLPVDLRNPFFVEIGQEAVLSGPGIHPHHIGRMYHRLPAGHQNRYRRVGWNRQTGVPALLHGKRRPHVTAIRRQLENPVVALVLSGRIDRAAVGSKGNRLYRTVPLASERFRGAGWRPVDLHQAVQAVERNRRAAFPGCVESLTIGPEHRIAITVRSRSEWYRLAAPRRDAVKLRGNRCGYGTIQIGSGGEDDAVAVGAPSGAQTRTAEP